MKLLGVILFLSVLTSCVSSSVGTSPTWVLTYLQDYDAIIQAKSQRVIESHAKPSINDNRLSEIKYNRNGQEYRWFSGCNGALVTLSPSKGGVKVEMSINQTACPDLVVLPDGRIVESSLLTAREIADEALSLHNQRITTEYIDSNSKELVWKDTDGAVIARFARVKAAE
jgi:hypothetical protein